MQVILVKELEGLGKIGDAVQVRDGYARNYLLPQKVAVLASADNLERVQKLKKEQVALEKKRLDEVKEIARRISALTVTITAKVGEEEKLFGSVTNADIEAELKKLGFDVDKRKIIIGEPIKKLGDYTVEVKLHAELTASLKVQVLSE